MKPPGGVDAYEQFSGVWDALEEYGLVKITPEKISLEGDGRFYTPMIQALLAEKRYRDLRTRLASETRGRQLSAANY